MYNLFQVINCILIVNSMVHSDFVITQVVCSQHWPGSLYRLLL